MGTYLSGRRRELEATQLIGSDQWLRGIKRPSGETQMRIKTRRATGWDEACGRRTEQAGCGLVGETDAGYCWWTKVPRLTVQVQHAGLPR
jgi:hypothetical protein